MLSVRCADTSHCKFKRRWCRGVGGRKRAVSFVIVWLHLLAWLIMPVQPAGKPYHSDDITSSITAMRYMYCSDSQDDLSTG